MDTKLTLCFDSAVISRSKRFAEKNNISLSRLIEFLLSKTTSGRYTSLDELPVSDWVNLVSDGEVEYKTKQRSGKDLKREYFASRK